MKKVLVTVLTFVAAQAALTVNAHPPQVRTQTEPNHYQLAYSAQDFQSVDTVKSLHERIVRTARQFCPTWYETGSISLVNICVNDVVDDLVGKIERPSLDAYVRGETEVRIAELVRKSRNNA